MNRFVYILEAIKWPQNPGAEPLAAGGIPVMPQQNSDPFDG